MKDWVLLSTWQIHLTYLTSPPPLLNSQTSAASFVVRVLRRESRFKGELPSSPSLFLPPSGSQPRGSWFRCTAFPPSSGTSYLFTFPWEFVSCEYGNPWLSSCWSRLIPTDRPISTSEDPPPQRIEDEVLVKVNLHPPLHQRLRRHPEKHQPPPPTLCRCQYFKRVLSRPRWQRIFYSSRPALLLMRQAGDRSQRWFWKAVLYCHGLTYSLKTVLLINHLSPFMFLSPPWNRCDEFN